MSVSQSDYLEELVKSLSHIDHIKPEEFPNIDLYMDQVTTFISSNLSNSKLHPDDKILTKTMINNYAKDNLLPAPIKKKYSKDHMIVLLFIYYLKNILSINDIQNILNPLTKRFFNSENNSSGMSMEDIYSGIFNIVKEELHFVTEDISQKINAAGSVFENVENEQDREFLQTFSLICMLSYDVFLKKQVISNIIDKIKADETEAREEQKKESKK
ncbi:MAG: DUF1836 domain-containing protein [Butyrivibrio sp.]